MKSVLNTKNVGLTVITLLLATVACKDEFLEVPVTGQISEAQLQSAAGIEGLLIGTYAALNGNNSLGWMSSATSNWLWGSIRGGDANKGSDAGDFNSITPFVRFEANATMPLPDNKWNGSFEGISRANVLLRAARTSEILSEEQKQDFVAQGRFLRGLYYFELKRAFNKVPFLDETLIDLEDGVAEVTNTTDIWPDIEADFQAAYDSLPETQDEIGKVNKWAAGAFLGRTYLYQEKFAEAKAVFDEVIANGVTSDGQPYGLVENFEDVFRGTNENHQESVFAFQAAANTGSINNTNHDIAMNYPYNTGPAGPGECCGFFQPSFELVNSYRTADGLPLLDKSYNDPANEVETDYGVLSAQDFTPDEGPLDPRLDHTIGRRGIMFLDWQEHPGDDWIRDQSFGGPYTQKKYSYYEADKGTYQDGSSWTPGYHSINYIIMRYADVLLMAAEAEVELGNLEQARTYVNMIRERAANSVVSDDDGTPAANYEISTYDEPWTDQEVARQAVRFERKLELALEGQRFFDLVRWGVAEDEINDYLQYEGDRLPTNMRGATFSSGRDEYLPIPQTEIDRQTTQDGNEQIRILEQNPGY